MSGYQSYQDYDDSVHGGSSDPYYGNNQQYYHQNEYDVDEDNPHGNYHGNDGYYDESGYYNSHSNNPYHQDGGYYDTHDGNQDDYYYNSHDEYGGHWDNQHYRSADEAGEAFSDFTKDSRAASAMGTGYDYRNDERYNGYGQGDDKEYRGYSPGMSYGDNRFSGASTPNESGYDRAYDSPRSREPYPAWAADAQIPLSKEEIEDIFLDLTAKFGFQRDSMRNMFDHLMTLLDSRASRMTPNQALLSLHADYIGGDNANYRKWYFAAHMDEDDSAWRKSNKSEADPLAARKKKKKGKKGKAGDQDGDGLDGDDSHETLEYRWKSRMNKMSQHARLRQVALYLLCWGEANQVRFMPECLCFIFKCADDFVNSPAAENMVDAVEEFTFLNNVITPLYQYIRDQGYEILDGTYVRREKDHNQIIGYDDCNQLFWYREGIERIILSDSNKTRLMDFPPAERYLKFKEVHWKKCFFKTYRETRSWFHLLVNFNRIWVIHLTMFWFYISYNAPTLITPNYEQELNNSPPNAAVWSFVAFGGAVATLINILATLAEWAYVPRRWAGSEKLTKRFLFLIVVFIFNTGPGVYIFMPASSTKAYLDRQNQKTSLAIGIVHFFIAVATFLYFAVMPLGGLFGSYLKQGRYAASRTFTRSYPRLKGNDKVLSYGLWATVFGAKLIESWYYLALTLRDPLRNLDIMDVSSCIGDTTFVKNHLCQYQPEVVMTLMIFTDLVLFFLDTYLWYVMLNTAFSICRSFTLGSSIWTPWKNVFSRLPKRIYSKVLATTDMEVKYKPKVLISMVWNAIVISMYREHLLGIDHVQKLLYHQVPSEQENKRTLRAPTFFVSQEDQGTECFPKFSEAERRISFFSQSLSTPIPEPVPVDNMPTFTVLIPHYSEKILLSLREIIREDEPYSRVTLLEYLKQLHPHEWECFVKDTKILAEESTEPDADDQKRKKIDDLPFYCIGFKSSSPEYTLRTRIWASLRFQTLYRTISGFMNYSRAIKLLYRVENPEIVYMLGKNGSDRLERELEAMARRKFKLLVSMQRYAKFSKPEMENTEFLLRAYPDLQIAYLDEEPPVVDGEEPAIYSVLIDGHSELMENGIRRPKFRVRLSGNPILGDGKSDNQNHSIIFYRGEYLQLVDANQDNYLEECLKIRSVLAEFEEMKVESDYVSPYLPDVKTTPNNPVAILGAREYIFSENIGILGDLAAGKEQTFGTLFARTLAQIGGKLHYGHPDFLNGIFMTTRGGVSKAQKGLHLNEDIYAGMTAMLRGGRIKHCEYYQCGKGRDLGFGSILNFTTKIGTGMGEQWLSREYYYMGTQLPLDRFLSFFYAHAGFHLNNMFIMLSLQMLMITLLSIGALRNQTIPCNYNPNVPIADPLFPTGCQNTDPITEWIFGRVLSIFIVFFINFIPLIAQEALERGPVRAATRFAKQIFSLSPFFEIFITQIYANSVQQDLSFGGARYIGTGRGFATARIPFGVLYSRFAGPSLYFGWGLLIMLLFATLTIWQPALTYFWISLSALVISPFLYNPHQFAWNDFFIDYREFIRWLSRGNCRSHASSWIGFCRLSRTRITGYKRKVAGDPSGKLSADVPRAAITNIFFSEMVAPLLFVIATLIPYLFINAQTGVNGPFKHNDKNAQATASLLRIAIVSFAPIAVNAGTVGVFFLMACFMGPILSMCCKKFGSVLAAIAHAVAVVMMVVSYEILFFLEGFNFAKTVIGLIAMIAIQRFVFKLILSLALTREMKTDQANTAFWTGKWYSMGWHSVSQPAREFLCKITEMSMFAGDFILGHILLFAMLPVIVIPRIDMMHSTLLFWLRPSRQIRPPIYSLKQTKLRRKRVLRYSILYFIMLVAFVGLIVAPVVLGPKIPASFTNNISGYHLIQPTGQNNNDTNGATQTGTALQQSASATASTSANAKVRLF